VTRMRAAKDPKNHRQMVTGRTRNGWLRRLGSQANLEAKRGAIERLGGPAHLASRQSNAEGPRAILDLGCDPAGGLARFFSALPNVQLICNERPLLGIPVDANRRPSTEKGHAWSNETNRPKTDIRDQAATLFKATVSRLQERALHTGRYLVLLDSDPKYGEECPGATGRNATLGLFPFEWPTRTIVLVSHPAKMFKAYVGDEPNSISACAPSDFLRHIDILVTQYSTTPRFRHEDIEASPPTMLDLICSELGLPRGEHMSEALAEFSTTLRRAETDPEETICRFTDWQKNLLTRLQRTKGYTALCSELGYETESTRGCMFLESRDREQMRNVAVSRAADDDRCDDQSRQT
jgi:hypothetical protein